MKHYYLIMNFILLFCLSQFHCSSSESSKSDGSKYGLTSNQYNHIRTETQPGGSLDYEPQFETNRLVVIGGVAYNKKAAALYTWGRSMKKFGIANADQAVALYENVREVKLTDPQRQALRNGFESNDK